MLAERGKTEAALAAAYGGQSLGALREAYLAALSALGEERESFFVPSADTRPRHAARFSRSRRPATSCTLTIRCNTPARCRSSYVSLRGISAGLGPARF